MRLVPLVLLSLAVAVLADDAQSRALAYYRAWYTLTVENRPESAKMWFEGVRKMEGLSAERDAACRLGLALCETKLGNTDTTIKLLAALRKDVANMPALSKRIEKLARRLGVGSHSGEFSIHYKQGFNFRTRRIDFTENADLQFSQCAGGISSVTFQARGGITSLEHILGRRSSDMNAATLQQAVASADPNAIRLRNSARGDSRTPESDVFIMRTRDGGWVCFAIIERGANAPGGRQELPVKIRYTYHVDRPEFGVFARTPREVAGVTFRRSPRTLPKEIKHARMRQDIKLMREVREIFPKELVAHPIRTQEVIFSRRKFGIYDKATFSFQFGIRDDPDLKRTGNDWDLLYDNSVREFTVKMNADDKSTINDLGKLSLTELPRAKLAPRGKSTTAPGWQGHIYHVHTHDKDSDFHSIFRVVHQRDGVAVLIEWVSLQGDTLKRSPALKLNIEQLAALKKLLTEMK